MSVNLLKAVWGTQKGYVFVPKRKGAIWDEGKAYQYPEEWEVITDRIKEAVNDSWDTYWCPLVFDKPKRLKENAKRQQALLWADLDEVDPRLLGELRPSVAWASSSARYQALWVLDKPTNIDDVENTNKNLTYHIGADKGGWDVTQVLRVPGTPNFKYKPQQEGTLMWAEKNRYAINNVIDMVSKTKVTEVKSIEVTLADRIKDWALSSRIREMILLEEKFIAVGERSDRLWEIETSLIEAGLPVLDVVDIIMDCAWNKFKGRRNEAEQIYNEVLKAEKYVRTKSHTPLTPVSLEERASMWAIPFDTFAGSRMEPPSWLVEGIWQKGTYGMIAGEPKTYKSVQATDIALSVASGLPFLDRFAVKTTGTVLYIQEENNAQTVQDRVLKIAASKGLTQATKYGISLSDNVPVFFSNNYGVDLTQKSSRDLLEETIGKLRPLLIILDPLYMMMGTVDENSAKEVGDVLRWLTYLRNTYSCSILLCHHYNKAGASTRGGQRVRGSSAFHAWVESALYVKSCAEAFTVKVEREFRAFPTMADITIRMDLGAPGELGYSVHAEEFEERDRSDVEEEVLTLLSTNPRTFDEIKALTTKISRRDLQDLLKELDTEGIIEKDGGSIGGRGKKGTYSIVVGGGSLLGKKEILIQDET